MAFTFPSNDAGYTIPDDSGQAEVQRPSIDASESVEREIIRQRIRAEIMAEEVARRRVLEEEIRMELMLERQMALHRLDSSRMRFDSYSGFPGLESSPFQRHPMAASPEPRKETILLAKPETYISGLKWKAPTPVSDHQEANCTGLGNKPKRNTGLENNPKCHIGLGKSNIDLEKKPKEWKCALCDISATSESGLREHMQGKKHKANVEGLGSQRTGFGTSPATNKSSTGINKPNKALESTSNPNVKKARKAHGKSSENASGKITTVEKKGNNKGKKHDKTDSTSNSKAKAVGSIENGKPGNPTTPNSVSPAKKFRFWCEMCQVGASNPEVFSSHKSGKKHLAMLKQRNAAPGSSQAVQKKH